jgi:hypothetical protein
MLENRYWGSGGSLAKNRHIAHGPEVETCNRLLSTINDNISPAMYCPTRKNKLLV